MIYIVYTLILKGKNTRKVFFHSQDPAMSPRGGLTMERIADGRCELVDLSVGTEMPTHTPGSAFSNRVFPPTGSKYKCWQMTLPPLQMLPLGSSVNDRGVGCSSVPRADRHRNSWDGGAAVSMGDCNSAGSLQ